MTKYTVEGINRGGASVGEIVVVADDTRGARIAAHDALARAGWDGDRCMITLTPTTQPTRPARIGGMSDEAYHRREDAYSERPSYYPDY